MTLEKAEVLDAAKPLAFARAKFELPWAWDTPRHHERRRVT